MKTLSDMYNEAAIQANIDGISAGDEQNLTLWIKANCKYKLENEYFLVLGIGCALAEIQGKKWPKLISCKDMKTASKTIKAGFWP